MKTDDLVTVIIPAYNAERTLDETLWSVRSQTHRHLEIFVIDDGSKDLTAQIILKHAAEDSRIQMIYQSNSGVAAARNRGIDAATSNFIAPIDADDLWRPDKIERQLEELHKGGDAVGLVYSWSAIIDHNSQIIDLPPSLICNGFVFENLLKINFCANGSSVLMRKDAVIQAGRYDPSLHARGAQGCEDYKLYLRIASQYKFAVVPDYLTGYRKLPDSMSNDVIKMLMSWNLVFEDICVDNFIDASFIRECRADFLRYLFSCAHSTRQLLPLLRISIELILQKPLDGSKHVLPTLSSILARRLLPKHYRERKAQRFLLETSSQKYWYRSDFNSFTENRPELDFGHFRPADPLGTTRHPMAEHDFQYVPERVRFRQNAAYRAEPLDRSGVLSSENGQSRAYMQSGYPVLHQNASCTKYCGYAIPLSL